MAREDYEILEDHINDLYPEMTEEALQGMAEYLLSKAGGDIHGYLVEQYPYYVITGADGSPYITRYLLQDETEHGALYIHHIHRADEDIELHNHPWEWATSIILKGGYVEQERGPDNQLSVAQYLSGDLNRFPHPGVHHRISQLLGDEVWTLIRIGPDVREWTFWHPVTEVETPWKDFILSKGLSPI